MPKSHREISPKFPRLLFIMALLAAAGLLFFLLPHENGDDTLQEEPPPWKNTLEKVEPAAIPAPQPTPEGAGPAAEPAVPAPPPLSPCRQTAAALDEFFRHLEEQEYIAAYELGEPVAAHINKLIIKLLNNPPIISKETDDIFTVLKNTAHFYRVLGHKDLSFIKDILTYERDDIEYLMSLFYKWSRVGGECRSDTLPIELPLKKTYEYAGFFLNTLGGQSYLFRRESNIRALTRYYCTLILHQAESASLNRYHINEAYTIQSTLEEIRNATTLENQEEYLATLASLSAKARTP